MELMRPGQSAAVAYCAGCGRPFPSGQVWPCESCRRGHCRGCLRFVPSINERAFAQKCGRCVTDEELVGREVWIAADRKARGKARLGRG